MKCSPLTSSGGSRAGWRSGRVRIAAFRRLGLPLGIPEPALGRAGATEGNLQVRLLHALLKTGDLHDAIFNSSCFSSIATDPAGVIRSFNAGAERMLGYAAAEVTGTMTPADLTDPEDMAALAESLSLEFSMPVAPGFGTMAFKASRGIEDICALSYIRKDGRRCPAVVSVTALRDIRQVIVGYLLIGTENTPRKRAEQALLKAGALQSAIFNSANFSSIATDAGGVIQIFNVGAERMLGYGAHEVINRITPADISDPGELIARAETLSAELSTPITPGFEALVFKASRGIEDIYELTYIRKDGSRFPALVSVTALRDTQNLIIGYLLIGTDNTARKRAEEVQAQLHAQLQQAQKMDSLGCLAGGVAHDMNNVLGAILALASANLGTGTEPSPACQAFATIAKAAIRGGQVVKSLLNVARDSPAEVLDVDINALLQEEVRLLERTTLSKVGIEVDLAEDLRPIRGDGNALSHAFINLCVNSVEAMAEGGTLTLRTRNIENGWIEVLVADTGCGMSREVQEKALNPFFTTKEVGRGIGLGLSMVYRTVKLHHGQLEIQSEQGRGTRMRLRFPAVESRARTGDFVEDRLLERDKGALAVLLVDDDELVLSSVGGLLEVMGHKVTAVCSGEAALDLLEAGFNPDRVILDMNMPGIGGRGTLPLLRGLRPALRVLLATGRVDQTALDLVQAHPHVALLAKPFTKDELQMHLA